MEVVILKMDRLLEEREFESFLKKISFDKVKRIKRFTRKEDANRTLIADVLIRLIVTRNLKIPLQEQRYSTYNNGKPYLCNNTNFFFNLSHSDRYIVCAHGVRQLGVDVESCIAIDLDIARAYFTLDENNFIFCGNMNQQIKRFYQIWTMKESYLKYTGEGLSRELSTFSVLDLQQNEVTFHCFMNEENIIGTVCSQEQTVPLIIRISLNNICDYLESEVSAVIHK